MRLLPLLLLLAVSLLPSCIVQAPKYTTVEKVLTLKLKQTPEEVTQVLGIPPYNFIFANDTETVLLYKYRVRDRITVPFFLRETNGKQVRGRYVNLKVTFNRGGHSVRMESCDDCDKSIAREKKVDFNKIMNVLTVTLPVVLVFLGIKIGTK